MIENNLFRLEKPRISKKRLIFYLVTLAALVIVYLEFSELKLISRFFLSANWYWLAGIIATQFFTYYFLALNYQEILKMKGVKIKVRKLFFTTFVIQFLNQAIPSATVSGQIFFIQYLKKYGLSLVEGIGRAIIEILTLAFAFGVFFLSAVILLAYNHNLSGGANIVRYILYIFLFISFASLSMFFAFQGDGRGRISEWFIGLFRRMFGRRKKGNSTDYITLIIDQMRENLSIKELNKHKRLFFRAVLWQGAILLLNVFTLFFISYSIGSEISFTTAFVAFILTKFISLISIVPGSLGIFEGGMTLILISFGSPADAAFAITLLFRAFSFWIPMPIGWLLYRYYTHRDELENPQ